MEVEGKVPTEWTTFRNELQSVDGVFFFTPEYNRSVPAALKNALDVGSRPYGASSWSGKPALVVKCFTRCDRWFWCEPSPASIIGILRYADFATTRSLYRWNHELDR